MKHPNELYVERLSGETIAAYQRRFKDKTGWSPTRETFMRGYKPILAFHHGTKWSEHHKILIEQVGEENYTWYGHYFFFSNEDHVFIFNLCCRD